MAKKRDIIIGAIIVVVLVGAFVFFGIMFIGFMSPDADFEITGFGGNVGIVEVFGVIDEPTGRKAIRYLDKWAESGSIEAIVVHVNSPGGGAAISQEIYDAIGRAREKKPVVTAMASVAASGGYYIACASDRIVANPGTLTGSIGVIFQFHTFEGLMDKIGIGTETVKSGELKDVGTYAREMTEKEELMLRSVVMDTYEQFVRVVADGRGKEVEEIYPLADGSIYTGLQALNLGLIDTLGGFNEALEIAADLAEMDGKPKPVRPYERKKITIFDLLGSIGKVLSQPVESGLTGPQLLYLYR
ncbi:MAG: signal peptide peptidase SppA [Candidatus Zixiibacteriota bacterium]|nr:MAG: signal peptide peptidase SppA [candidate division Zixibacteria bacterium]